MLTNELLQIVPFHQRALGNKKYYEDLIRAEGGIQLRAETERYIFLPLSLILATFVIILFL